MKSIRSIFAVPLLLLGLFVLAERDAEVAGAVPPPPSAEASEDAAFDAAGSAGGVESGPSLEANVGASPLSLLPEFDPERSAIRILEDLAACAESGLPVFPTLEVEEIRSLLTRHPELEEWLIAALDGIDRRVRSYLAHAFYGLEDETQRDRLVGAVKRSDPQFSRLDAILSDTAMVLEVLREPGEPDLRADLIGRLGASLLGDESVVRELRDAAERSEHERVRQRALQRLGKVDRPEITRYLLTVLCDQGRDLRERQTAAMALRGRQDEEVRRTFLSMVESRPTASLLRHAALGLRGDPLAFDALVALLIDPAADVQARKNAGSALAATLRALPAKEAEEREAHLCGHLSVLMGRNGSGEVIVHTMGELARALGEPFESDIVSMCGASAAEPLLEQMLTDPTLKRVLENR